MNTGRLLEFVGLILGLETGHKVQDKLVATHRRWSR